MWLIDMDGKSGPLTSLFVREQDAPRKKRPFSLADNHTIEEAVAALVRRCKEKQNQLEDSKLEEITEHVLVAVLTPVPLPIP